MKSTPLDSGSFVQAGSRWARLVVASAALAAGISAWAQNAVSTFAGTGATAPFANGTGTVGVTFQFTNPTAAATDTAGNIYVADAANHVIRKITSAGVVTTFAGTPASTGTADGAGLSAARFNLPRGIAVDGAGNVYVADTNNHTIRMITPAGNVSTLAGTAGNNTPISGVNWDATGTAARFNAPFGIACDRAGTLGAAVNLYVADTQNNTIRKIVVSTGVVTTLAGTAGSSPAAGTVVNGTGPAALFNHPDGIVSNGAGTTLYVADTFSHVIRQIVTGSGAVTTLAGSATAGALDSTGTSASFNNPAGIALDSSELNVLVSDTFNHTIRTITTGGGVVTTYAGLANTSGNANGLSTAARFNFPSGIASTGSIVYVLDTNNQIVRRITAAVAPSITTQPSNGSAAAGGTVNFTVVAGATTNPPPSYQWQINPGGTGSFSNLSPSATYSGVTSATLTVTGVTAGMNNDKFQVIISNGVGSAATSSAATLTVTQPPVFTSVASANFTVGQTTNFNVTATGSPAPTISFSGNFPPWASFNTSTNTLTGSPTDGVGSPYTFTFTATNTAGSVNQTFTATVLSGPTINSHPSSPTVSPGQTAQFSVSATSNAGAVTYQWQRQQVGTFGFFNIVDNGHYSGTGTSTLSINSVTLPESGDQFRVIVSSGVGTPATSNAGILTVTQSPVITSLGSTTFVEQQFGSFTVQATGSPTPTFSLTGGSLPSGVSFNPSNGVISGTPAVGTSTSPNYTFQITASNGVFPDSTQTFTLTVSPTALIPTFTTQPANVTIALGQTTTFTVVVTGSPIPTLQWQRQPSGSFGFNNLVNDTTFSGVTTSTLTITNPTSGMSGDLYRVVASNTTGSNASASASLTIVVGTTISTYAGAPGQAGATDGIGTASRFNNPSSIAVDLSGNVYVADSSNHVIRKIAPGGVVTTLAGQAGFSGSSDGTGTAARFNAPSGIAVNSVGTVYVADTFNHTVRVVNSSGSVTTMAGSAGISGTTDGQGANARFTYPSGIAVDSGGGVYVADTSNHTIRRIQSDGTVTVFAGSPGLRGAIDGSGTNARFAYPNAVAIDSSGNLYVADSFNHAIRKITTFGSVTTLAGSFGVAGSTDAPSLFNQPSGVAVDSLGNVFVADTFNHSVRRISSVGVVTTIAGYPGLPGSADGIGSEARFNQPYGMAVDSTGNIYVADTRNHIIRRTGSVTAPQIQTQPQNALAAIGGTATFTVTATGAPTPSIFQWTRQAAGTIGFVTLSNDGTYNGVTSATLTVSNVTQAMNGDQFQVVVSNLISPNATSTPVTLVLGTAPVFTSAANATFQATNAGAFNITTNATPSATYSAVGLPAWATLNTGSGVITGIPPDTNGSPFTVTITANNGIPATQTLTITVLPAVLPPTITNQPVSVAVDQGQTATFSVGTGGTAPFTYEWRRNGVSVSGATGATLTIANAQASAAGTYTVTVTNSVGVATSVGAALVVNTMPTFVSQPRAQTVLAGSVVTFSASATGGSSFNYQWRRNGIAIVGATNATLTINGVTTLDAGNYDVQVSNGIGLVTSSLAQLTIVTAPSAPVISVQPAARTALLGTSTTLAVAASGAPSPSYQWRKDGIAIANATGPTLTIASVQLGDAGNYDVVVSNSVATVASQPAGLRVITRSYAGTYFGSYGNSLGNFALYVRDDNTGVFLSYLPGSTAPVMNLNITVNDSGAFSFAQASILSAQNQDEPPRAAALAAVTVSGTIAAGGAVSGSLQGGASASLTGTRSADVGTSQGVAGYYQAGSANNAAVAYTIAGATGQAFVVTQVGATTDGGAGSVSSTGVVNVVTTRSVVNQTIVASNGTLTGTSTGGISAAFNGGSDAVLARQRLVNISSRARVGTGDAVAIAGFVIAGEESKPVLIRAVGPTLGTAPFNVAGALAAPRLELFRGSTSVQLNTGIAANRVAIDAAGVQAGAFPLGTSGADAAILTTLAPGNYTAQVSSTTNTAGVALIEVYDLSAASPGQKLLNIATRASAGTGDATLIAGFVIPPGAAKRVLVRGVGPGLTPFGVSGVLAQPTLILLSGSTTVAQNSNWSTSVDAAAITAASVQAGAFGLANNDSAVVVTLAPGNYTAQVVGAGGTTGVALIEVYELP